MDWAAFFKDYGQPLFTLGGVFLGSAITFLINWLNLRNQSKEHDKDRREQRKEAKTQLALEIMRNDIKILENSIDNELKALTLVAQAAYRRVRGDLSGDGIIQELYITDGKYAKLREEGTVAEKLAYSFGNEFHLEYQHFDDLLSDVSNMYIEIDLNNPAVSRIDELIDQTIQSAGKLHSMLHDKLISIRDS